MDAGDSALAADCNGVCLTTERTFKLGSLLFLGYGRVNVAHDPRFEMLVYVFFFFFKSGVVLVRIHKSVVVKVHVFGLLFMN